MYLIVDCELWHGLVLLSAETMPFNYTSLQMHVYSVFTAMTL